MLKLIKLEFYKLFSRSLSWIGFIAIIVIVMVIQIGMFVEGQSMLDFLVQSLSDVFSFEGKLINNYTVSYVILNSLWLHIPILVAIVAGDMVSGEAGRGTFRLLLTRPVSRLKLLTAKHIAAQFYAALLVVILLIMSLYVGRLFFQNGDLIVMMNTINIFDQSDVAWRFYASFGYGIISMWAVSGLAFFLSTQANNSLEPLVGSMSILIVFTIISNFSMGIFDVIKPFLFTTYLSGWQLFFDEPVDWRNVANALLVLFLHIFVFFGLSAYFFRRKDIIS